MKSSSYCLNILHAAQVQVKVLKLEDCKMLKSHPNSSGPSLGNSANWSCGILVKNLLTLKFFWIAQWYHLCLPCRRSWVQILVLALFLIEDRAQSKDIQVKTQINEPTFYLRFELKTRIYEENPIERNFQSTCRVDAKEEEEEGCVTWIIPSQWPFARGTQNIKCDKWSIHPCIQLILIIWSNWREFSRGGRADELR